MNEVYTSAHYMAFFFSTKNNPPLPFLCLYPAGSLQCHLFSFSTVKRAKTSKLIERGK
jgi:hypothetical protein